MPHPSVCFGRCPWCRLPTSLDYPDVEEVLLYRNMLCSQDFKQ